MLKVESVESNLSLVCKGFRRRFDFNVCCECEDHRCPPLTAGKYSAPHLECSGPRKHPCGVTERSSVNMDTRAYHAIGDFDD